MRDYNGHGRILVISHRGLRPTVCRCCQNEFEDVVAEVDSADVLAPPAAPASGAGPAGVMGKLVARAGLVLTAEPKPQAVRVRGRYDLCFVVVQGVGDLSVLDRVHGWRESCRKAICWVEELWAKDLAAYPATADPLRQFDHVFVTCGQSAGPLGRATGVPCEWGPSGVDALRFCPRPGQSRAIDVLSIGRRARRTHEALLGRARAGDFFYVYDSTSPRGVINPRQHRELFASMVKRSRFFLAYPGKVNAPEQTGGQEEIGFRYFEGAAGGAVLLGRAPAVPGFAECFDWPDAVIPLPYDSADVLPLLDELAGQPQRLAAARRNAAVGCLLRHDWVYRWAKVLDAAGLPHTAAMADRVARLTRTANLAAHGGMVADGIRHAAVA